MNPVRDKQFAYVYVLRSEKDGKFYTGCTQDLRKRFQEHIAGKGGYTKHRGPYTLIYYEASKSLDDAYDRERYLKSGMGKRYIRNRLKRFLSLTG
ncbi:MAG: GIY-YIG nuclease family protein [Minisyncoccia bacterium]